jgi:hypothetical protein
MLGFLIVPLVPIVLMALALSLAYVEARLPPPRGGRHPDVTQLRRLNRPGSDGGSTLEWRI